MGNKRGSVGKAFRRFRRYHTEKEFKEKQLKRGKEYHKENTEKHHLYFKKWYFKLKKDLNKKCIKCQEILCPNNKSGLCKDCFKELGGVGGYLKRKEIENI